MTIKRKCNNLPLACLLLTGSAYVNAVNIENPGFEDGLTDWTIIDPASSSDISYNGEKSLKIEGSPARVHQWVSVAKNTDYILTAYVKGAGKVGVNNKVDVVEKAIFDVDAWTKMTVRFNSKSQQSIQVYAKYSDGTDQVRFDDFKLVKADDDSDSSGECKITKLDVTASDDGTNNGHKPELAVDGSLSSWSYWSSKGYEKWLQLDLGAEKTIDHVDTAWLYGDESTYYYAINASSDGKNWSTVLYGAQSKGNESLNSDPLNGISARYLRILGYGNISTAYFGWNNILEAAVYGCDESTTEYEEPVDEESVDEETVDEETVDEATESEESQLPIPNIITDGSLFEVEGDDPLVDDYTLKFVPLEMQVTTPNGNGWRHEYKIEEDHRAPMTDTYETFQATIKVDLSDGGKTIVAQHHTESIATIMKLYVSDTDESGFMDSEASNGIFDVYVRIRNTSGKEEKKALGTIKSGDSFTFKVVNDYGLVKVSAFGKELETEVEDDSESYFKFGNYLQSQCPEGTDNCGEHGDSSSFAKCFKKIGITESVITMTDVSYTRKTK